MRKTMATGSLLVLALCGAAAARADSCSSNPYNVVSNCGFETGDFTGWSGSSTTDTTGNYNGVAPGDSYQGAYAAYLGAIGSTTASATTLSQTFATIAGQQYTVQFALDESLAGFSLGYPNYFAADFGSTALFTESNVALSPYVLYTETGIATGSSTTLSFSTLNDGGYFDLDDVTVIPTPEPSSLLLLGTGLLGAVGVARRRFTA